MDAEAYDAYLHGLALLRRRGRYIPGSIAFFNQAIAKDSTFARAYAQLGTALSLLAVFVPVSLDTLYPRALAAANRAVSLDPSSAEAHAALGAAYLFVGGEFSKAIDELDSAIALDPGYATVHFMRSNASNV